MTPHDKILLWKRIAAVWLWANVFFWSVVVFQNLPEPHKGLNGLFVLCLVSSFLVARRRLVNNLMMSIVTVGPNSIHGFEDVLKTVVSWLGGFVFLVFGLIGLLLPVAGNITLALFIAFCTFLPRKAIDAISIWFDDVTFFSWKNRSQKDNNAQLLLNTNGVAAIERFAWNKTTLGLWKRLHSSVDLNADNTQDLVAHFLDKKPITMTFTFPTHLWQTLQVEIGGPSEWGFQELEGPKAADWCNRFFDQVISKTKCQINVGNIKTNIRTPLRCCGRSTFQSDLGRLTIAVVLDDISAHNRMHLRKVFLLQKDKNT